jgi:hypothetical protein
MQSSSSSSLSSSSSAISSSSSSAIRNDSHSFRQSSQNSDFLNFQPQRDRLSSDQIQVEEGKVLNFKEMIAFHGDVHNCNYNRRPTVPEMTNSAKIFSEAIRIHQDNMVGNEVYRKVDHYGNAKGGEIRDIELSIRPPMDIFRVYQHKNEIIGNDSVSFFF